MSNNERGFFFHVQNLLNQDYRGVNIAVYALATAGLAVSIHRVRPVSKFSKASKVPDHFIKNHEPLRGVFAGVQHSPVRLLVHHRAPIYLPLWHSSKPPLPVKLWGVDIVSGNAVNWLECVAKDQHVTLKPIAREKDDLVSTVLVHLPQPKSKTIETLDLGQKLVELGFAKASVPQTLKKNTIESKLAPIILSAEAKAKTFRNGIWSDHLPPVPFYIIYWRKGLDASGDLMLQASRKLMTLVLILTKNTLIGLKNLALKPFKSSPKQIQNALNNKTVKNLVQG